MATHEKFVGAVQALRLAIRERRIAPGEALIVEALTTQLRISATPIREALAYLAGEGVAERRARGYRVRPLEPRDLRELYRLHLAYVLMGLDLCSHGVESPDPDGMQVWGEPISYRERTERLWSGATRSGEGHPRLQTALHAAADQLSLARLIEPDVLVDTEEELEALEDHLRRWDADRLRAASVDYHQRRIAAVLELSAAIYWRRQP